MTAPTTPEQPNPQAPQFPPFTQGEARNSGPGPSGPGQRRKPLPRGLVYVGSGLVLGLLLGIAGTTVVTAAVNDASAKAAAEAEANKPRPLPEAVDKCKLNDEKTSAKLGDDGRSLTLDSKGKEDYSGLSMTQVDCVLKALKMPDSISDQMGHTRALDGTQRDSWASFSVSWNYHPDNGLNVILKQTAG